ncbi:hypothetical protein FACS1894200_00380 [Spirochaetia bacterium]|nr:hypothetical protein FACS1894200_00380 [Spirochaetia bacterium]
MDNKTQIVSRIKHKYDLTEECISGNYTAKIKALEQVKDAALALAESRNQQDDEAVRNCETAKTTCKSKKNEYERQNKQFQDKALGEVSSIFEKTESDLDAQKTAYEHQNEQEKDSRKAKLLQRFDAWMSMGKQYTNSLMLKYKDLGAVEEVWTEEVWSKEFEPANIKAKVRPDEIMLGDILVQANFKPLRITDKIKENTDASFRAPYTLPLNEPVLLCIEYDDAQQKAGVMTGIQTFIMKLLRFMPLSSFTITYIDPADLGSNLGLLNKLTDINSFDVCKEVYKSEEDIRKRLKDLEAVSGKTTNTLAGIESLYVYNEQNAQDPLIYNFVIINDFPDNIGSGAMKSLDVLIRNARKCGISIIISSTPKHIASIPAELKSNFTQVKSRDGNYVITCDGVEHPFEFGEMPKQSEGFIEAYKKACNEGIKVDNRFETFSSKLDFSLAKLAKPPVFEKAEEADEKILIPFALDSRGELVNLELGGSDTHALLSGTTGSGKSETLHTLITSIIMRYSPDDVQLWLVDYKLEGVEFAEYIDNPPPHVKLIGLERSAEFTFSLFDKINEEFKSRSKLFKDNKVNNITEFRENNRKNNRDVIMPRIVLIIDEFHQMTQAVKAEPSYRTILENILSEYRSGGLSCIFSDQAVGVGLEGLSAKGFNQINTRLAMKNPMSEIREMLKLDSVSHDETLTAKINRMGTGDVIFKRNIEDGSGGTMPSTDKYKVVWIKRHERQAVMKWLNDNKVVDHSGTKRLVVDGQHRQNIEDALMLIPDVTEEIHLYVGTPTNLNPYFSFTLTNDIGSNVLVIGAKDEMRGSVVYCSIKSFLRQDQNKVYVFAYSKDKLYRQLCGKIESLEQTNSNVTVLTDIGKICACIDTLHGQLKQENTPSLIVWFGLERIAQYFRLLPEKSANPADKRAANPLPRQSAVGSGTDSMLNDMLGDIYAQKVAVFGEHDTAQNPPPANDEDAGKAPADDESQDYNALPDVQNITYQGPLFDIFSLVTFGSYKLIKDTKCIKSENFEHKIAFKMSLDESQDYLGRGSHASGLDDKTAVYFDGSTVKTFRPYKVEV